jgi:ribosomal protein L37AE/L43A
MSEEIKLKCPYCGSDEFKREYAHKWAAQKVVNVVILGM